MSSVRTLLPFVVLCIGSVAIAAFLRLPAFDMPLDRDLAAYATIGRRTDLFGFLPYRDVFDHKQPLVYVVFWVLNLVAPQKVGAIRLAAALPSGLTAALLLCVLRPRIGLARAVAAGLLVLVLSASTLVEGTDLNTEHLLVLTAALPVLAALWWERARSDWVPLGIGLLVGLAVLTKAVGIFVAPAALLPLVVDDTRSRLRAVLLVGIGTAIPLIALALGYLAVGGLSEMWHANITYNRLYAATGHRLALPTGRDEILALVIAALAIGSASLIARSGTRLLVLTFLVWLAGCVVGAQLSSRSFPHYYAPLIVPACALLCCPVTPARSAKAASVRLLATGLAAIAALLAAAPFARSVARSFGKTGVELAYDTYGPQAGAWTAAFAVGEAVRHRARPGDRMFVLGAEPEFYWTSDVTPASYYIYDRPARIEPRRYAARIQHDVCGRPPRWLIDTDVPKAVTPPSCLVRLPYRAVAGQSGVRAFELGP